MKPYRFHGNTHAGGHKLPWRKVPLVQLYERLAEGVSHAEASSVSGHEGDRHFHPGLVGWRRGRLLARHTAPRHHTIDAGISSTSRGPSQPRARQSKHGHLLLSSIQAPCPTGESMYAQCPAPPGAELSLVDGGLNMHLSAVEGHVLFLLAVGCCTDRSWAPEGPARARP